MADLNKSILDTLRKIWEKLCTIADLLQNPATTSSTDPEVVCLSNDGGATVVTGWEVFDTATNPPTSTLYIGGVAVTGYSVVPCSSTSKDREILQVCVDGKVWTKVVTFEGDLPITFLWLDDTDAPVAAPDPLLINNANCSSSNIGIEQYSGLGNGTQNSSFNANEVTITYDASMFTTTPLTATIIATGLQGTGEFKVQPNTQETRKFNQANITGVSISGASGNNVTIEFQLN